MQALAFTPKRITLYAAVLAMAALVVTVLAVSFATGPAQAQDAANTFPNPQPCGPGLPDSNFPGNPAEQITSGHYALFDAYWHWATVKTIEDEDSKNTGSLNNNQCPPAVTFEEDEYTRSASDINIGHTVIHVGNQYKVDVVDTNAQAGNTKFSLAEYEKVGEAVLAGTKVYWLRLDDPDTAAKDETSDLVLGFSTAYLDGKYWYHENLERQKVGPPLQYELEAVRYRGPHAADLPHVFAYRAPKLGNQPDQVVWDSIDTDTNEMQMEAGAYEDLQWVFTHAGTYVLEVHVKGHVRQRDPNPDSATSNWEKITDEDTTVTSEVKEYVIQVGSLSLVPQPLFGVNYNVKENVPAGTKVGGPIPVLRAPSDANLKYRLRGDDKDKEDFKVVAVAEPRGAQIVVNDNANVDHEARSHYELVVEVSDGVDHMGNADDDGEFVVDHTFGLDIAVDDHPTVRITADNSNPRVGDTVTVTATIDLPSGASLGAYPYQWNYRKTTDQTYLPHADTTGSFTMTQSKAGAWEFRVQLQYLTGTGEVATAPSNYVTVTWSNQ